jgi:hypothetical protein
MKEEEEGGLLSLLFSNLIYRNYSFQMSSLFIISVLREEEHYEVVFSVIF